MTKKDLLIKEVEESPEAILDEVLDFLRFIKNRSVDERMQTAVLSESSLKKDWLTPEEDAAWRAL